MPKHSSIETPRRLAALAKNASPRASEFPDPPRPAGDPEAYVMPSPRFPFVVFRFTHSDEPAYGIILRRGDRSLDLGVFAANHRTIQQMDGVRHASDPDLARMAEFLPGIWAELPEVEDLMTRLELLEDMVGMMAPEAQASSDGE